MPIDPIEIEFHLQKNSVWDVVDGRSSNRIAGVKVSFGEKLVYRESQLERIAAEEVGCHGPRSRVYHENKLLTKLVWLAKATDCLFTHPRIKPVEIPDPHVL